MSWLTVGNRGLLSCQVSKFGSVLFQGHRVFSRQCLAEELGHAAGWRDELMDLLAVSTSQFYGTVNRAFTLDFYHTLQVSPFCFTSTRPNSTSLLCQMLEPSLEVRISVGGSQALVFLSSTTHPPSDRHPNKQLELKPTSRSFPLPWAASCVS